MDPVTERPSNSAHTQNTFKVKALDFYVAWNAQGGESRGEHKMQQKIRARTGKKVKLIGRGIGGRGSEKAWQTI